tara:strand:+ start:3540 stop:4094 length:555 start_codon:yes stop_codon:yes gene_type:complete
MTSTFGDLGSAVVIIFIFTILHGVLAISIGISNIKNNWEYYKCNPSIMPFASVFGHDVAVNFNECIQTSQVDFMSSFLEPIYQSLNYFAQNGAIFTDIFEEVKLFGNSQDNNMGNFVEDAKARLYNMSDGANRIFIGVSDTFSKLTSTITVIFYTLQSALVAGESAWNELPGTFIKIASFGALG